MAHNPVKPLSGAAPAPRRIIIDLFSARNRNVGVGEFCHQLAMQFAARAEALREEYGIEFHYIVPRELKGCYGEQVDYLVIRQFLHRMLMPLFPKRSDLFHAMHQYAAVKHMSFAANNLMTVHDVNFMAEKHGLKREKYARSFQHKLRMVSHLNFISKFTQNDVLRYFDVREPFRVIYNGVTDLNRTPQEDISRWNLPERFLFHISSLQPKKNPDLLIEMMQYLPEKHLVIVGNWKTEYGQKLKHHLRALKLMNVTCLDHVSAGEKAALFAQCEGFLFPSLCEGFGLPPLEAMLMGKPAFLSTLTSLPEVGGSLAYYWDKLDPAKMANRVRAGLADFYSDPANADRMVAWAPQFSWERCSGEYIDYYLEILGLRTLDKSK